MGPVLHRTDAHWSAARHIANYLRRVEGARVLVVADEASPRVVVQENGANTDVLRAVLRVAYEGVRAAPRLRVTFV